jgi:hypothetical protein
VGGRWPCAWSLSSASPCRGRKSRPPSVLQMGLVASCLVHRATYVRTAGVLGLITDRTGAHQKKMGHSSAAASSTGSDEPSRFYFPSALGMICRLSPLAAITRCQDVHFRAQPSHRVQYACNPFLSLSLFLLCARGSCRQRFLRHDHDLAHLSPVIKRTSS